VHLLLTPAAADSASLMMKHLGQRYVQYVNRQYRRSGTLWEGRYRSCLMQSEAYVLACSRYIELNPVRAGIVKCGGQTRSWILSSPHGVVQDRKSWSVPYYFGLDRHWPCL
jgi:REP element-mobilizing transposase RayT